MIGPLALHVRSQVFRGDPHTERPPCSETNGGIDAPCNFKFGMHLKNKKRDLALWWKENINAWWTNASCAIWYLRSESFRPCGKTTGRRGAVRGLPALTRINALFTNGNPRSKACVPSHRSSEAHSVSYQPSTLVLVHLSVKDYESQRRKHRQNFPMKNNASWFELNNRPTRFPFNGVRKEAARPRPPQIAPNSVQQAPQDKKPVGSPLKNEKNKHGGRGKIRRRVDTNYTEEPVSSKPKNDVHRSSKRKKQG